MNKIIIKNNKKCLWVSIEEEYLVIFFKMQITIVLLEI